MNAPPAWNAATLTSQMISMARHVLESPLKATNEQYDTLNKWFINSGLVQDDVAASKDAMPVVPIVWTALATFRAARLDVSSGPVYRPNVNALRTQLRPDTFLLKRPIQKEVDKSEVLELKHMMEYKLPPFTGEGKEHPNAALSRLKIAIKELHMSLSDVFYWLRFRDHMFNEYPIREQFDLVSDVEIGHMTTELNRRLQEQVSPEFDRLGREMILQQQLPIGSRNRFQASNPQYGDRYGIHDVLQSGSKGTAQLQLLNEQSKLPFAGIGTDKQHTRLVRSTIEVWQLKAFAEMIKSLSVDHLDFIEDYCVLWYDWGDEKAHRLLTMKTRLYRARLPLFVNWGDGEWYILHKGVSIKARAIGGVIPALCMWHRLVTSDCGGLFEDGTPLPNYLPLSKRKHKKKSKRQPGGSHIIPNEILQVSKAMGKMSTSGGDGHLIISIMPTGVESLDDPLAPTLSDEFGLASSGAMSTDLKDEKKEALPTKPATAATTVVAPSTKRLLLPVVYATTTTIDTDSSFRSLLAPPPTTTTTTAAAAIASKDDEKSLLYKRLKERAARTISAAGLTSPTGASLYPIQ